MSAHPKTPIELLYLELGAIPVRFVIMSRRINFLWYLLHDKEGSLLKNFFQAQCEQPIKGDWVSTVKQDLSELGINMSFKDIEITTKEGFKELVKQKVKGAALDYLKMLQKTHSKAKNLNYSELSLQQYLKSGTSKMTIKEKCFAFAARSRTIDVKCNKLWGQKNLRCRLGCDEEENQAHLLQCKAIAGSDIVKDVPKYEDIYMNDVPKIETISKILNQKFNLLKETFDKNQVHSPIQACAASASSINIYVPNVNVNIADELD